MLDLYCLYENYHTHKPCTLFCHDSYIFENFNFTSVTLMQQIVYLPPLLVEALIYILEMLVLFLRQSYQLKSHTRNIYG